MAFSGSRKLGIKIPQKAELALEDWAAGQVAYLPDGEIVEASEKNRHNRHIRHKRQGWQMNPTIGELLEVWPGEAGIPATALRNEIRTFLREKYEMTRALDGDFDEPISPDDDDETQGAKSQHGLGDHRIVQLFDVLELANLRGWPLPKFLRTVASDLADARGIPKPKGRPKKSMQKAKQEFRRMKAAGELSKFTTKKAVAAEIAKKVKMSAHYVGRELTVEWEEYESKRT